MSATVFPTKAFPERLWYVTRDGHEATMGVVSPTETVAACMRESPWAEAWARLPPGSWTAQLCVCTPDTTARTKPLTPGCVVNVPPRRGGTAAIVCVVVDEVVAWRSGERRRRYYAGHIGAWRLPQDRVSLRLSELDAPSAPLRLPATAWSFSRLLQPRVLAVSELTRARARDLVALALGIEGDATMGEADGARAVGEWIVLYSGDADARRLLLDNTRERLRHGDPAVRALAVHWLGADDYGYEIDATAAEAVRGGPVAADDPLAMAVAAVMPRAAK